MAGADKHLSRLLSTFSAASPEWAPLTHWFAADLHSWDTILKGLPSFSFPHVACCKPSAFLAWVWFCLFGILFVCLFVVYFISLLVVVLCVCLLVWCFSSLTWCCRGRRKGRRGRGAGGGREDLLSASHCLGTSAPLEKYPIASTAWQRAVLLGTALYITSYSSVMLPATRML